MRGTQDHLDDYDPPTTRRVGTVDGFLRALWFYCCLPYFVAADCARFLWERLQARRQSVGLLQFYVMLPFWLLVLPLRWCILRLASLDRNWWHLLEGAPAVVVGVGSLAVLITALLLPDVKLIEKYSRSAWMAYRAEDFDTARLYFRRLVYLEHDNPTHRFQLALALDRLSDQLSHRAADLRLTAAANGQPPSDWNREEDQLKQRSRAMARRALDTMNELAPVESVGYGRAHVWLAQEILAAKTPSPAQIDNAVKHLQRALEAEGDHLRAQSLLGRLYVQLGKYEEAEPHLAAMVEHQPSIHLTLAKVYRELDRSFESRKHARLAARHFERRAQKDLSDYSSRLAWSDALSLISDYRRATDVLAHGRLLVQAHNESGRLDQLVEVYDKALARLFYRWAEELEQKERTDLSQWVLVLLSSLHYDTSFTPTLKKVAELSNLPEDDAREMRNVLRKLLADGKVPATVHLVLGTDAWSEGRDEIARKHLASAFDLNPKMPSAVNNMARALAGSGAADLNRALKLSESAVAEDPENHDFRETRGQVLYELGRFDDALKDLTFAVGKRPDDRQLHVTLSAVYDKLGRPDMAARHREQADRFQATVPEEAHEQ